MTNKLVLLEETDGSGEYVIILSDGEFLGDYIPIGYYVAETMIIDDAGTFPTNRLLRAE